LHPLDFNNFVNNVPEFTYLKTAVDTYQFTPPIDSSDMAPELWTRLVSLIEEKYNDNLYRLFLSGDGGYSPRFKGFKEKSEGFYKW